MRDGFRFSFAANEFSVAAIAIALLAGAIGYEYTHRTYPPAPIPPPTPAEACIVKEPTITIEQTFFIPVPAQIAQPKTAPDPEIMPKEEDDVDPVFEHRQVIVTKALQTPMSEMAKN